MSENEPHVSTDELRAALAPRGDSRRNPVLVSDHSVQAASEIGELGAALDAARADAIELRAALDASRGDASELRAELVTAKTEARERRTALDRLARAGLFRRRRVLKELEGRGLV
jgi:hypothetical protein